MPDWVGNALAVHTVNQRGRDAQANDYYATDPKAVTLLLEQETFSPDIWEPACGEGHISKVLDAHGYTVHSTDIFNYGYSDAPCEDFLTASVRSWHGNIITNPPYKYAKEFVEKALSLVEEGRKVTMFVKLTFLEGQARRELFRKHPPKTVYVSSARLECGKNGRFTGSSAVVYCWIVWEKGFKGIPQLKWIN